MMQRGHDNLDGGVEVLLRAEQLSHLPRSFAVAQHRQDGSDAHGIEPVAKYNGAGSLILLYLDLQELLTEQLGMLLPECLAEFHLHRVLIQAQVHLQHFSAQLKVVMAQVALLVLWHAVFPCHVIVAHQAHETAQQSVFR